MRCCYVKMIFNLTLNGQNDYNGLIPLDYDMDGDGKINIVSFLLDPQSGFYDERLALCASGDMNLNRTEDGGFVTDDDMDDDKLSFTEDDDWDNDGMLNSYEVDHGILYGGWQNPFIYNARYAVIVGGGIESKEGSQDNANFPAFWNDIVELYGKLIDGYNYLEENVYLMYSYWRDVDHSYDPKVDGKCTWNLPDDFGVDDAIVEIGKEITLNDFFFFAEACHGYTSIVGGQRRNTFVLSNGVGGAAGLTFDDFTFFLDQNLGGRLQPKRYARMVIVLQSCFSGGALDGVGVSYNGLPNDDVTGEDRIVISSSTASEYSWCRTNDYGHLAFLYGGRVLGHLGIEYETHSGFTPNLGMIDSPHTTQYAFDEGKNAATHNYLCYFCSMTKDYRSTPQMVSYRPEHPGKTYL